jgi:pyruvate/oxaloacetate carboxyltransferase
MLALAVLLPVTSSAQGTTRIAAKDLAGVVSPAKVQDLVAEMKTTLWRGWLSAAFYLK